jgi:hypothetical protein
MPGIVRAQDRVAVWHMAAPPNSNKWKTPVNQLKKVLDGLPAVPGNAPPGNEHPAVKGWADKYAPFIKTYLKPSYADDLKGELGGANYAKLLHFLPQEHHQALTTHVQKPAPNSNKFKSPATGLKKLLEQGTSNNKLWSWMNDHPQFTQSYLQNPEYQDALKGHLGADTYEYWKSSFSGPKQPKGTPSQGGEQVIKVLPDQPKVDIQPDVHLPNPAPKPEQDDQSEIEQIKTHQEAEPASDQAYTPDPGYPSDEHEQAGYEHYMNTTGGNGPDWSTMSPEDKSKWNPPGHHHNQYTDPSQLEKNQVHPETPETPKAPEDSDEIGKIQELLQPAHTPTKEETQQHAALVAGIKNIFPDTTLPLETLSTPDLKVVLEKWQKHLPHTPGHEENVKKLNALHELFFGQGGVAPQTAPSPEQPPAPSEPSDNEALEPGNPHLTQEGDYSSGFKQWVGEHYGVSPEHLFSGEHPSYVQEVIDNYKHSLTPADDAQEKSFGQKVKDALPVADADAWDKWKDQKDPDFLKDKLHNLIENYAENDEQKAKLQVISDQEFGGGDEQSDIDSIKGHMGEDPNLAKVIQYNDVAADKPGFKQWWATLDDEHKQAYGKSPTEAIIDYNLKSDGAEKDQMLDDDQMGLGNKLQAILGKDQVSDALANAWNKQSPQEAKAGLANLLKIHHGEDNFDYLQALYDDLDDKGEIGQIKQHQTEQSLPDAVSAVTEVFDNMSSDAVQTWKDLSPEQQKAKIDSLAGGHGLDGWPIEPSLAEKWKAVQEKLYGKATDQPFDVDSLKKDLADIYGTGINTDDFDGATPEQAKKLLEGEYWLGDSGDDPANLAKLQQVYDKHFGGGQQPDLPPGFKEWAEEGGTPIEDYTPEELQAGIKGFLKEKEEAKSTPAAAFDSQALAQELGSVSGIDPKMINSGGQKFWDANPEQAKKALQSYLDSPVVSDEKKVKYQQVYDKYFGGAGTAQQPFDPEALAKELAPVFGVSPQYMSSGGKILKDQTDAAAAKKAAEAWLNVSSDPDVKAKVQAIIDKYFGGGSVAPAQGTGIKVGPHAPKDMLAPDGTLTQQAKDYLDAAGWHGYDKHGQTWQAGDWDTVKGSGIGSSMYSQGWDAWKQEHGGGGAAKPQEWDKSVTPSEEMFKAMGLGGALAGPSDFANQPPDKFWKNYEFVKKKIEGGDNPWKGGNWD